MSATESSRHPATENLSRWLTPNPNLPVRPRTVAAIFAETRDRLLDALQDGPELSAGLRHLLEAKDACVRQSLLDTEAELRG
ncbi:Uncharacterised protein [Mycobacteroides abscessus subsp. bolletii]|uniref:hypothetical protein n=1 Tax=Mycobacteroides abscessus TaxID=36809 RepID=UPI0009A58487|nr:hypothetical protein [Mycobacteroides abscessus]SKX81095.1 Uncharacterised protein [Mycobacteroides abscessus subsp. bolletii]